LVIRDLNNFPRLLYIYLMPPYGGNGSLSGAVIFSDQGDKKYVAELTLRF